jgi:ribosomal protein S27AE
MKRFYFYTVLLTALLAFTGCGEKREKVTAVRTTVQTAEVGMTLKDIATMSYSESNPVALSTMEEVYSPLMAKMHPACRKAAIWFGGIALVMFVVFLYPTIRRSKFWNLFLMLPYAGVLFLVGKNCIMPTWIMMITIPIMAYVVCYPLLYTGLSRSYVWIAIALTMVVAALYLWPYVGVVDEGGFSLMRLLLWVLMMGISFVVIFYLTKGNDEDVCPHCGYFAYHKRGDRRLTGTDVSYGSETDTVYDGTTESYSYSNNTKTITKHYHDEQYSTKTVTKHYDENRTCVRCGKGFIVNVSTESTSRKRVG